MTSLLAVNVGKAKKIDGKSGLSGIFKEPQSAPVAIGKLGLEGDTIIDTKHHGGVDQAVYIYFQPDYAFWKSELGREIAPGTFGENLTISDHLSTDIHVGDRFEIGTCVLEVNSPRIPCVTFATRMGDPKFIKRFQEANRPGVYCRVIETGTVAAGDEVKFVPFSGPKVPANLFMDNRWKSDPEWVERARQVPVHFKIREELDALT